MECIEMRGIKYDIRNLIDLFYRFSTKRRGERVDLEYIGDCIRTSIVLVGKRKVVAKWGSDPYVNYVRRARRKGVDMFYILARGKVNTCTAVDVLRRLENEDHQFEVTDMYEEKEYDKGEQFSTACIACLVAKPTREASPSALLVLPKTQLLPTGHS